MVLLEVMIRWLTLDEESMYRCDVRIFLSIAVTVLPTHTVCNVIRKLITLVKLKCPENCLESQSNFEI